MEEHISQLPEAWQLAIQREKESHDFYTRMAQSSPDASLKALFEALAAEETRHRERLEAEYRRLFESDMEDVKRRTGVFEHEFRAKAPPLISWWEWGEEAFRLAETLDVPILLSISAVWCHWCHVMDRTTFADPEIASYIDAHFVPVRVDNDKRPDINARYNMGGWPTVAFLTPSGEILTGGTYMAPAAFKATLQQVSDHYRQNKEGIRRRIEAQAQIDREQESGPLRVGELDQSIAETVYWSAAGQFDQDHGGFGQAPKFPQVDVIELAMARNARTGEAKALEMAVTTLRSMAQGGICDHEMGGFFRYSTTRDWSIPHFEKMLEDNARLLSAYLHGYLITGEALFRETAEGIVSYVESTLRDRDQAHFYGSQDADEKYYALAKEQREKRPAPYVDTVAYTSWNAMMSSAYLEAAAILERPELATSALATLNFLWKHSWSPEQGMYHYWDREAHLPGLLADQVWMVHALLHAYEYRAAGEYLQRAEEIAQWMHSDLATKAGSFQDRPSDPNAQGRLRERDIPITENAVAVQALIRLSRLTRNDTYIGWAQGVLRTFAKDYGRYGLFAASYAMAVEQLLREPLQVVVVGSADDAKTLELLRAAWRSYAPNRTLLAVDPVWQMERLKAWAYPAEPAPIAYICLGHTCAEPVTEAAEVTSTISGLIRLERHSEGQ